jgi:hypothetical protein
MAFGLLDQTNPEAEGMSATDAPRAPIATPGTVQTGVREEQAVPLNRAEPGVATELFVDVRVRSLLMGEARRRLVTRMFGVPREDQSFLVTMIVIGAVATVLRGFAPRPLPRASGAEAAMGGAVLNATLRGIAGAPSRNMPLAGALMGFAALSHSLRPAVAGSAREVRALARGVRAAFGARYRH